VNEEDTWRAMLRMELGASATVAPIGTVRSTPMTIVIQAALRQTLLPVSVWWADRGPPSMFCLGGTTSSAILFSTRSIELDAQTRWLFGNASVKGRIGELAYRLALTRISEHLLVLGRHELALAAVLESVREQSLFIPFGQTWQALERIKIDEGYMSIWFFGLAHEFGHILANQMPKLRELDEQFDRLTVSAVNAVLRDLPWPEPIKRRLVAYAQASNCNLSIQVSTLREECLADVGACSLLHESSINVLSQVNRELSFARFAWEILTAGAVRSFSDSAFAMARVLSGSDSRVAAEAGLSNMVATNVRSSFRHMYLLQVWSNVENRNVCCEQLDLLESQLRVECKQIEDAMGAAARFLIARSGSQANGLPTWISPSLAKDATGQQRVALARFVSLAKSFETDCADIHALGILVDA
jgi:hypothetical protein